MTANRGAGAALTMALVLMTAWPAAAGTVDPEGSAGALLRATLDGAPAEDYDVSDPLPLRPDQELAVGVEVTNQADIPLVVRSVRLEGRVLGMTFIDYDTRVDAVVAPGETVDRSYTLDLGRLNEQAVGLLPVELSILDGAREPVAIAELVVDARGRLTSAYGLFGLLVASATALLLAAALVHLVRGTLPEHRWYRAVRFAVPGAGVGLTLAVTLSALRVMVPNPELAVSIVVVCALVGLVLGFLTPTPDSYRPNPLRVVVPGTDAGDEPAPGTSPDEGVLDVRDEAEPVHPVTPGGRASEHRHTDRLSTPAEQGKAPAER